MPEMILDFDQQTHCSTDCMLIAGARTPMPCAFQAVIRKPRVFRTVMLALGRVIRSDQDDFMSLEEFLESVMDPVVGVHPDGLSFEGFSNDGSTLGWAHFTENVFSKPTVHECGCTNIDFSAQLERYIRGMTPAQTPDLKIGTWSGVEIRQNAQLAHKEKKIDLPESWVRGFGEMHAALAAVELTQELTKPDLLQLINAAKRKAPISQKGRAFIFHFRPGEPTHVVAQPWGTIIRLKGKPPEVHEPIEWKVYGRRRLELMDQIIPHVKSTRVHLLGDSRPTFWEFGFEDARFIFAMSAWTTRKFTKSFVESLTGPAALIDEATMHEAAAFLADNELVTLDELGEALGLEPKQQRGVAMKLCRRGLAVAEPGTHGLRWRPLLHLPFEEILSGDGDSSRETYAAALINDGKLVLKNARQQEGLLIAKGTCEGREGAGAYELSLTCEADGRMIEAACTCKWMARQDNSMRGGPCKHLLALRMAAQAAIKANADFKSS